VIAVTLLERSRPGRIALALLAGILYYFALGLNPVWQAAWLAPVPLLVAAFHASGREAAMLSWLAVSIGIGSNFTYYLTTTGSVATIILIVLQILLWDFLITRTRAAFRTRPAWLAVFVFPVLLSAAGELVSYFSPHGTWGSFAYTQMNALPVIQIASVFGTPAILFLLGLFSSTAALAICKGLRVGRPRLVYGIPLVLLVTGVGFGEFRIQSASATPTWKVGLASIDDFIGGNTPPEHAETVWRGYEELVAALARQGARIVVLPEKIAALQPEAAARRQAQMASLARRVHVYLVVGVQLDRPRDKFNVSWLFSPAGELLAEYRKQRMVPHLESDLTPGTENMVRTLHGTPFGLAICRDLIFSGVGRRYGELGVSSMLVPAWDFYRDAWMESGIATMRGVENGYAVVRAGRESYLNVSDRFGRTVARRSAFLPGSSLLADVPVGAPDPTFYARHGEIFGWLSVAAATCFFIFPRPFRTTSSASPAPGPETLSSPRPAHATR
jgi:apolipoprotein N-acyltransferase